MFQIHARCGGFFNPCDQLIVIADKPSGSFLFKWPYPDGVDVSFWPGPAWCGAAECTPPVPVCAVRFVGDNRRSIVINGGVY